jgi:hypothetical protein
MMAGRVSRKASSSEVPFTTLLIMFLLLLGK